MSCDTLKVPPYPPHLLEAAQRYGTPTYLYLEEIVRRQCASLRLSLGDLPVRLLYAMKANAQPALLRIIRSEGYGIDAVSPAELLLALRCGFAPDEILYSANNMSDDEMHEATRAGVLLNIGETTRLERFGRAYPGSRVCLRLNPQIGSGHHEHVVTAGARTKFGIPLEDRDTVLDIARTYNLDVVGLHQHIGSGIAHTEVLGQAVRVLLDAAAAFPSIRFLNFGGGLNIPYRPDDPGVDLDNFAATVVDPLRAFLAATPRPDFTFRFEPGRFLVAEAGVLLVTVTTLKSAHGRLFAGTDSGMGHLVRPTVYGAYHAVYNLSHPDGPLKPYDIVGNICESGDVFARDRLVQEIREGDVLALLDAGAYGMSMASTYNLRPLPAEAMLRSGGALELLRARRTPEALVEEWLSGYGAATPASGAPAPAPSRDGQTHPSPPGSAEHPRRRHSQVP